MTLKIPVRAYAMFITVLLFIVCPSAFALIGENTKQIETRYGKPIKIEAESGNFRDLDYASHGFLIMVHFIEGISRIEAFGRPDKSNISSDAVRELLALSADKDQTWRELPQKDGDRFWSRSDRGALAVFPAKGNFFFVQDPKLEDSQ
ncbi:MAG TPA: hypothetical protein VFQ43_07075 [Nitrososphaera sp.]|nr:hypothetical protein [Nitrososphaera sp.]